jgi:uncharacterized repeat protein (TIGR03803 family)
VIADESGNLYGTAAFGGTVGGGTVFKRTKDGTLAVLHSFCSRSQCDDGANPQAGLYLDAQHNLYGTTAKGGASHRGVVFELGTDGSFSRMRKN